MGWPLVIALVVAAGAAGAAIGGALAGKRSRRDLAAAHRHVAALDTTRQDLLNLAALTRSVSGADWQRSVQTLLMDLVERKYCTAATLLSLSDSNQLEVRATSLADGGASFDASADPHMKAAVESKSLVFDREAGALYLPVVDDGELLGLLHVCGVRARPEVVGQEEELAFVSTVGELAKLALSSIRTFQRQAALSSTDGLTGLYNHRHFQQLLGVALAQSYLQAEPLSLMLFDIDHFKKVNDTYGHLFGDLVLREVAYITRRVCPSTAIVARYGGEEVAVVLPGTDVDEAGKLADRLRETVAQHQILDFATGAKVAVTISVGVAAYQLGQGKGRLVNRADEALYASKHGGRNRVTLAPPDTESAAVEPQTL